MSRNTQIAVAVHRLTNTVSRFHRRKSSLYFRYDKICKWIRAPQATFSSLPEPLRFISMFSRRIYEAVNKRATPIHKQTEESKWLCGRVSNKRGPVHANRSQDRYNISRFQRRQTDNLFFLKEKLAGERNHCACVKDRFQRHTDTSWKQVP